MYAIRSYYANRFLVEAYPLAGLIGDAELRFAANGADSLTYAVALTGADGEVTRHRVFAPNREHADAAGEPCLSPTGWLRVTLPDGARRDGPLETDLERLFAAAVDAADEAPDPEPGAPPRQIRIAASLPWPDTPLGCGDRNNFV